MNSTESQTAAKSVRRKVVLRGLAPIMFDRYAGDNDTKLAWWQKVTLIPESSVLALPTMNIVSFLSAHNTNSAPKRLRDPRKYKNICNACLSFVMISGPEDSPDFIPFLREGKVILVADFKGDRDPASA